MDETRHQESGVWKRADFKTGEAHQVVIDDFGFTGEGYVRLEDGWLSVPGALPGEVVEVRLQQGQRPGARRLFADVVAVVEPADDRRDPLCEQVGVCRGCQLRHLTVDSELRFKVRTVREVMERYGGLEVDKQPEVQVVTPQPIARGDAFRIRSQLSYRRGDAHIELGLYSPVSRLLVDMGGCPALIKPVQRLVQTIGATLEAGTSPPEDSDECELGIEAIKAVAPNHGVGLVDVCLSSTDDKAAFGQALQRKPLHQWLKRLARKVPAQVGVAVSCGEFRHHVKEPRRIRIPIGRFEMEIGYDDWFHATLEPAEVMYATMMEWLELTDDDRLIDVGCGTGTITVMTAATARQVVGLDINSASIEAAEINAMGHGRENVEFLVAGWEKGLRQLAMDDRRFSVATINPMRQPLGRRTLAFLGRLGVERAVYLGPSPEAAAKDIGALRQMGWKVRRLAAANLHPATYHTMLMALVENQGGDP